MWEKEVTIQTGATKERVWEHWADVENWSTWDPAVQHAQLNGPFEAGTKGILQPTSGPRSEFIIISATAPTAFTTQASLPLAKMDFTHRLTEEDGALLLTHGVKIRGITSFLFSLLIGKKIIAALPEAMNNLSAMAQKE